jgi:hypothetical protein
LSHWKGCLSQRFPIVKRAGHYALDVGSPNL